LSSHKPESHLKRRESDLPEYADAVVKVSSLAYGLKLKHTACRRPSPDGNEKPTAVKAKFLKCGAATSGSRRGIH